ncbi:Hca operon transcriptional activator [compost metagenome]
MTQLDQAVENARLAQNGEIGKLNVGFVGSATYDILPPLIREFQNRYPHVVLKLEELSTPDQIEALYQHKIDIGFIRPPVQNDSIHVEVVDETPCILALPKQHPLTKLEKIPVSMLKDHSFVCVSRSVWPGLYDDIVSFCEEAGFTPKIKQFAHEYQTVIGLVSAGIGVAVVPASLKSSFVKDVEYRELAEVQITVKIAIAFQENKLTPEANNFIEIIHSSFLDPIRNSR